MKTAAPGHMTECGLPGIRAIPYGLHMCHFYEGREALAAALAPYFAAGLRANERCLWLTAEPLGPAEAERALAQAGIDAQAAARNGSLVIRPHTEWHGEAASLDAARMVQRWLDEEARALAQGYAGLRIAGNTSFVTPEVWAPFMDYEAAFNEASQGRRIVTLCSYPRSRYGAADVLEIAPRHHCTLDRPDRGWQILSAQTA